MWRKNKNAFFILIVLLVLLNVSVLTLSAYAQWEIIDPPYVSPGWQLHGSYCTSSNEGWAVGENDSEGNGVLLHYLNGSWTAVTPPTPSYVDDRWTLERVHFTSPDNGWAVGYSWDTYRGGVILKYSNGVWTAIDPPYFGSSTWTLNDVYFVSSNEGWAVGSIENKGLILHYSNGVWTFFPFPISSNWALESVYFTSSSEGWAVGWLF